MKNRDLELELEAICEQNLFDVESVIMRFGHGDCHDLTLALMERAGFKSAIVIMTEESKMPIHSCVLIDDNTTLDAYGVNSIERTLERYKDLAFIYCGDENIIVKRIDQSWFNEKGVSICTEIESAEDILAEFQIVLDYMGESLKRGMDK